MKHKKGQNVSGWLIVDKPEGIGSTAVVNMTRRLFDAKKNGHAGTLDPFASGVLPIAFGEATKLLPFVTDGDKEYEFVVKFGEATDTLDLTGQITAGGGRLPSEAEIRGILPCFLGDIEQTPPVYSALKINGQRAYELARRGEDVEIPKRIVKIYELDFVEMVSESQARIRVRCSKGTYVRSLGADLAAKLGTYGHLTALRRTKCGKFGIDDTILLENLKNIEYVEERKKYLRPLLTCLCDITVIAVGGEDAAKLRQGQGVSPKHYDVAEYVGCEAAAVCDGRLAAIVRIEENRISPVRVFNV